jgi:hypothetical protein
MAAQPQVFLSSDGPEGSGDLESGGWAGEGEQVFTLGGVASQLGGAEIPALPSGAASVTVAEWPGSRLGPKVAAVDLVSRPQGTQAAGPQVSAPTADGYPVSPTLAARRYGAAAGQGYRTGNPDAGSP